MSLERNFYSLISHIRFTEKRYQTTLMIEAFPTLLSGELKPLIQLPPMYLAKIGGSTYKVNIKNEVLQIPYRIHLDESILKEMDRLSELQIIILRCYFTRHHNGYVREHCLRRIISSQEPWVIPFVIQLLGEYVGKIIEVIRDNVHNLNEDLYKSFLIENPAFYELTKKRVMSYWDCYYRNHYPEKTGYAGFDVVDYFDSLLS